MKDGLYERGTHYWHDDSREALIKLVRSLETERDELSARLSAISKPVTDEEWLRNSMRVQCDQVGHSEYIAERVDIDDILASRSQGNQQG